MDNLILLEPKLAAVYNDSKPNPTNSIRVKGKGKTISFFYAKLQFLSEIINHINFGFNHSRHPQDADSTFPDENVSQTNYR